MLKLYSFIIIFFNQNVRFHNLLIQLKNKKTQNQDMRKKETTQFLKRILCFENMFGINKVLQHFSL